MKVNKEMLDYVKALTDTDRLKIVGQLAGRPARLQELATSLSLPVRKVFNHLAFLQFVGVVHEEAGSYSLDAERLEQLTRRPFVGEPAAQTVTPVDARWKPIASYLNRDGTIRLVPSSRTQAARFRMMLDYLLTAFEADRIYTEKEVNQIIRRFHADTSGLRRDLVEAGLLGRERDGSRYWRIPREPQ
jgi:hypothetical protein